MKNGIEEVCNAPEEIWMSTPLDDGQLTPLMKQYLSMKRQHPDKLLLYRLGDFYELFFEDAEIASRELDITLTSRDRGVNGERIPLAGVPYHALDSYLPRLIKKGFKVVIAEQVEDPKTAKGLVKREIVRIVTPGTFVMPESAQEAGNTFLCALCRRTAEVNGDDLPVAEDRGSVQERVVLPKASYGLAHLDVSTGDFLATEISGEAPFQRLVSEIMRYQAAEVVVPRSLHDKGDFVKELSACIGGGVLVTAYPDHHFLDTYSEGLLKEQFHVLTLEGTGLTEMPLAGQAAGAVLSYARENQMCDLSYIKRVHVYGSRDHLVLDSTTLRNLEVVRSLRDGSGSGTLMEVLDQTRTAMGSRMLKAWLLHPLMDMERIEGRSDCVGALHRDLFLRSDLRDALKRVADLERLLTKLSMGRGNARDLVSLKGSLEAVSELKGVLEGSEGARACAPLMGKAAELDPCKDIIDLVSRSIVDEPPAVTREGGMIRPGYSSDLDEIARAAEGSKEWLKGFEAAERERTGIRSLKVRFNSVFGYYIEVSRSNLGSVPADYMRKQTLANCERFITPELKEKESLILNSEERKVKLEQELFEGIVAEVLEAGDQVQRTAGAVAFIDVIASLADVSSRRNYCRPRLDMTKAISLKASRHPVIEDKVEWGFVANDLHLDGDKERLIVLTGPNMAGKSTYMRQAALIVIMAQMGSFVPAAEADIGIVDRIFTRVGATDDLARGQSTFMVEMVELANILNSATDRSLVLLDEIGRGTSTFDGLAIAWAVTEHLADPSMAGCKTIFATHYHHLTELEGALDGVVNCSMSVKEDGNGITFLRKVKRGPASRSYGIEVASLAGVPPAVVERAREVLHDLEESDLLSGQADSLLGEGRTEARPQVRPPSKGAVQMVLFPTEDMLSAATEDPVREELSRIDVNNMTPMQALEALYKLKKKLDDKGR